MRIQGANVDGHRPLGRLHVADSRLQLIDRMDHGWHCSQGQQPIGHEIHTHIVREALDQGGLGLVLLLDLIL